MDGHQVPGSYIYVYKSCILSLFPATFHTSKRLDTHYPTRIIRPNHSMDWKNTWGPGPCWILCYFQAILWILWILWLWSILVGVCFIQSMEMPRQLLEPKPVFVNLAVRPIGPNILLPTNVANFPIWSTKMDICAKKGPSTPWCKQCGIGGLSPSAFFFSTKIPKTPDICTLRTQPSTLDQLLADEKVFDQKNPINQNTSWSPKVKVGA